MELFTSSHDPDWERIVHIHVEQTEGIPDEINDEGTYKVCLLDAGTLTFESGGLKQIVTAPAIFLLTTEKVSFVPGQKVATTTVFFKPTEIREEFTLERMDAGEFENLHGSTLYQDYMLVKVFEKEENGASRVLRLGLTMYGKLSDTIRQMKQNLVRQSDGFWPCRSRSFLMELLYAVSHIVVSGSAESRMSAHGETAGNGDSKNVYATVNASGDESAIIGEVIQYLNEHIGEKVTLEEIETEFSVNRNRLNQLFVRETSLTCMQYLMKLRMSLAQIMLAETDLRIGEIAARTGYDDANYFNKVFQKFAGTTPSKYRDHTRYDCDM